MRQHIGLEAFAIGAVFGLIHHQLPRSIQGAGIQCGRGLRVDTFAKGNPCAAQPAIALRVFQQIVLMVFLGAVVVAYRQDFGGDGAKTGLAEIGLIDVAALFGQRLLRRIGEVDRTAVIAAQIIALPAHLGGVVVFPERGQQRHQIQLLGVMTHAHHFGMVAGVAATTANQLFFAQHIFIAHFRCIATGIAHFHFGHAGHRTQAFFRAPKTTHPKINILQLAVTHGHGSSRGGGHRAGTDHPPAQKYRSGGQQQCQ